MIAKQGSTTSNNPNVREAALRADMIQTAMQHYSVTAQASVGPARRVIMREHSLRPADIMRFLWNNPLVPVGREELVAEGLYAGFAGDMSKAVHLLVHQIEHSIRTVLAGRGVAVTALDAEGLQSERNIDWLLYEPLLKELFGEDLVFSLQGLLVEKFGANMRNMVAHGLLDSSQFYSTDAVYLWWLCFRYYQLPLIARMEKAVEEQNAENDREDHGA